MVVLPFTYSKQYSPVLLLRLLRPAEDKDILCVKLTEKPSRVTTLHTSGKRSKNFLFMRTPAQQQAEEGRDARENELARATQPNDGVEVVGMATKSALLCLPQSAQAHQSSECLLWRHWSWPLVAPCPHLSPRIDRARVRQQVASLPSSLQYHLTVDTVTFTVEHLCEQSAAAASSQSKPFTMYE